MLKGMLLLSLAATALLYVGPSSTLAAEYTRLSMPNAWTIPAGETDMNWNSDDFAWLYSLPFPFPFFDTLNTTVWISSNGLISLRGPDSNFTNGRTALAAKRAIAVLWDDLRTDNATVGTDIFISTPDSNHVMIRWKAVTFANNTVEVNFETLLGSDGTIQFNYGANTGAISATVGISDGRGRIIAFDITNSNFIESILFTPTPGKPTASFTYSPSSPFVGTPVTFNASASSDDGFITSYNWTFGEGSPAVVDADPVTTHTYTSAGVFNVILRVTDNDGILSEATQSITVMTTGLSPLARFTATPERALLGQTITFNASASVDPDGGQIVSYLWTFGDGNSATGRIVTYLYGGTGTFLVGLTVTDDEGSVGSIDDSVTIVVADVRLLDVYSEFRVLRLRQSSQITFYAEAINIGATPVYALVRFSIMDLKTGNSSVFSTNATLLNVRDQYLFQLSYSPLPVTTRYLVLATVFLSAESLPADSLSWLASSQATFAFRVIR